MNSTLTEKFWATQNLAIVIGVYVCWLLLVLYGNSLPVWLLFFMGGYVTCLHGSLQHIAVHGYPTRYQWLNSLIVYPPLIFFYPYPTYRESHTIHHQCEVLTEAEVDPESVYLSQKHWDRLNALGKIIYRFNFTLAGRLLIGPFVSLYLLWKEEFQAILAGDRQRAKIWLIHIAFSTVILIFVTQVGEMAVWKYLLCFAYPGISLTLLRSYCEHRWSPSEDERSLIIEGSPISRLLYLNNNYHWIHHENPALPWQQVSIEFDRRKEEILRLNGNYYYRGYLDVFKRLWKDRSIDPVHPYFTNSN